MVSLTDVSDKLKINAKGVKDVGVVVAVTAGCAAEGCPGGGKVRVSSGEIFLVAKWLSLLRWRARCDADWEVYLRGDNWW